MTSEMRYRKYEDFIHDVCRELEAPRGVQVSRAASFTGKISGRKIVVDVSCEAQLLGARILCIVECKCYSKRVGVSDVEEFHSKLDDIGAHKGIMFTTVGYEAGAMKVAAGRGIALFVLGENQAAGAIRIERKSATRAPESDVLRGSFYPHGERSEGSNIAGIQVKSADELFYALAFSDAARFGQIEQEQRQH